MRRRTALIGATTLMLALILPPLGEALACGTVRGWIAAYERGARHKALFHMLDCASSYQAPKDDLALFPVINDAIRQEEKIVKQAISVFVVYNCLYGARNQPGYGELVRLVGENGQPCKLARYERWYVVTSTMGANLRESASLKAKVLTAVQFGMQVELLGVSGDWYRVKPVGPGSVDPRYERVTGFIHKSLLAKY